MLAGDQQKGDFPTREVAFSIFFRPQRAFESVLYIVGITMPLKIKPLVEPLRALKSMVIFWRTVGKKKSPGSRGKKITPGLKTPELFIISLLIKLSLAVTEYKVL